MGRIGWQRVVGAVALVAATALMSACGGESASEKASDKVGEKLAEKAIEDSGVEGVDVDIDGEDVTIESDEGTIKVGSGDVPESFPDELSIVDGDIVSSIDTPQGAVVTLEVDDAVAAFEEAVADLEGNGWSREQLTEAGETRLAMFTKGDLSAMVMADTTSGQITYTVGTA